MKPSHISLILASALLAGCVTQTASTDRNINSNTSLKTRADVNAYLKHIDEAKYQWALENNKKPGDVPTEEDLGYYIAVLEHSDLNHYHMPAHPQGGRYIINPIGVPAESTLYGKYQP